MSDVTTEKHNSAQESAEVIGELLTIAPEVVKETREGYKTTEFWVTVLTAIGPLLAGVPEKLSVPVLGVVSAAYVISRGLAKKGVPATVSPALAPPAVVVNNAPEVS